MASAAAASTDQTAQAMTMGLRCRAMADLGLWRAAHWFQTGVHKPIHIPPVLRKG
jgi:hypothetical protein